MLIKQFKMYWNCSKTFGRDFQGRRKHLKLEGARHFKGTFINGGHFMKKGTFPLIAKSWGHVPTVPHGSYVSGDYT